MYWLKRNKNRMVVWGLVAIVLFETFMLSVWTSVDTAEMVELKRQNQEYASTTAAALAEVDRMYELNDIYIATNEKLGKANESMGNAMRKYCPAGLVTSVQNPL